MYNSIFLIQKDLTKHIVKVKLPGDLTAKQYYLIEVNATTNILDDLEMTYKDEFTKVHREFAEKNFGNQEKMYTYGVLLNDDFQMVHSFNRLFADYNSSTEKIEYKNLVTFLFEKIKDETTYEPVPTAFPEKPFKPTKPWPGGGGNVTIRYSLIENNKK